MWARNGIWILLGAKHTVVAAAKVCNSVGLPWTRLDQGEVLLRPGSVRCAGSSARVHLSFRKTEVGDVKTFYDFLWLFMTSVECSFSNPSLRLSQLGRLARRSRSLWHWTWSWRAAAAVPASWRCPRRITPWRFWHKRCKEKSQQLGWEFLESNMLIADCTTY